MRRLLITFWCVAALALAGQRARGFALLGPFIGSDETWQTIAYGFGGGVSYYGVIPGAPLWLGDLGGPKLYGEEFRRNEKYIYYAYDDSFGGPNGFFGLQGETNADMAFAMMNNIFTNYANGVDGYSANLTEFPFNSQHFNGTAQGLYLTDLKSVILHLLVEQMGLADPERFTWDIRLRGVASPPGCPLGVGYFIIQRNYGTADQPLTGPETGTLFSPYVNNLYYTYNVLDDCGVHGPPWTAITVPFSTDTTVPEYTSVAANNFDGADAGANLGGLEIGGFYSGLTEDDVAGLRYLLSSNTVSFEIPAAGAQLEFTNTTSLQLLQTANLYALLQFAQTNPPAALLAQYPNLVIDSVSNYFTLVTNWNVYSYFYQAPGSPAGIPPVLVIATNGFTLSVQTNYVYSFGNLVIVHEHTNTPAHLVTTSLSIKPGSPAGDPIIITNVTIKNVILNNVVSGDYYLLPPDSCGYEINSTLVANYFAGTVTNVITMATNTATTNSLTGFVGSESLLVRYTNNWYEVYGCSFVTSSPAYYRGIEGVQFVRAADGDVDPLTEQFTTPFTNTYTMIMVNSLGAQQAIQTYQRIVTQPDILMTAADLVNAGTPPYPSDSTVTRSINFDEAATPAGASGPGVIDGQSVFDFNKVGTGWWNGPFSDTNSFLLGAGAEVSQNTGIPALLWASFDGTTNPPIVYPTGASIQELEDQMVITISPTSLPNATNGMAYMPTTLTATGGTPPYAWTVASGSLPNGLVFPNGTLEGLPNGNTNGVYDITIQLTDSSNPAKVVNTPYTITVYSQ